MIDIAKVRVRLDKDGDVVTDDEEGLLICVPAHEVPGVDRVAVANRLVDLWNQAADSVADSN